ncbi:hypothetical protein KAR91_02540 [Candidatus Pacearchaeota archaeon]|nr:hypothetical protein [Candidatus Pacearchaeota archaeon]
MLAIIKDLRLRWQQIKRRRTLKRWRCLFEEMGHPHAHMSNDEFEAHLLAMLEMFRNALTKVNLTANQLSNVFQVLAELQSEKKSVIREEVDG